MSDPFSSSLCFFHAAHCTWALPHFPPIWELQSKKRFRIPRALILFWRTVLIVLVIMSNHNSTLIIPESSSISEQWQMARASAWIAIPCIVFSENVIVAAASTPLSSSWYMNAFSFIQELVDKAVMAGQQQLGPLQDSSDAPYFNEYAMNWLGCIASPLSQSQLPVVLSLICDPFFGRKSKDCITADDVQTFLKQRCDLAEMALKDYLSYVVNTHLWFSGWWWIP